MPPLVPEAVTEERIRRELRSRGLPPREVETLVLRFAPVDGRRRTLVEIAAQQGYTTKGRGSQLITRALKRVALTHRRRPLPAWLLSAIEAKPHIASLIHYPIEERPLSFLRIQGVQIGGLQRSGVRSIGDVLLRSDLELLAVPGIGPKALRLLRRRVADLLGSRKV